ncbi:MAG: PEP-CTERM sorting domain-containing protein [Verrucomicrobiota bacterium]
MKINTIKQTIVLAAVLAGASHTALGLVTQGASSAYGISANTQIIDLNTLLGIGVSLAVPPTPLVSGVAPAPYSLSNSLASFSATSGSSTVLGGGTLGLSSGVLTVTASSTVDGGAGSRNAQGSSTVANFSSTTSLTGRTSLLNSANLFGFTGSTVSSFASVTGDYGAFTTSGGSRIVDASGAGDGFTTFTVFGVNFNVAVNALGEVAPNTTLTINSSSSASFSDSLGTDLTGSLSIILNEQILSGDGITSRGLEVNALHVTYNNAGASFFNALGIKVDDANRVNGGFIVGHSQASLQALQAVPEPSTCALFGIGGCLAFLRFRALSKRNAV